MPKNKDEYIYMLTKFYPKDLDKFKKMKIAQLKAIYIKTRREDKKIKTILN
jgi:hypothetical protein